MLCLRYANVLGPCRHGIRVERCGAGGARGAPGAAGRGAAAHGDHEAEPAGQDEERQGVRARALRRGDARTKDGQMRGTERYGTRKARCDFLNADILICF